MTDDDEVIYEIDEADAPPGWFGPPAPRPAAVRLDPITTRAYTQRHRWSSAQVELLRQTQIAAACRMITGWRRPSDAWRVRWR